MGIKNRDILTKYLRHAKSFPHIWCPGCGNGIVMGALLRGIDNMGWEKDKVVMVSGIGCAGRAPVYVDFNTLHTAHGRALTFATGLKLARPDLNVIVVMGDGDAVGIGGNHFIHACRRNIDINTIIINNFIYGMTGGQQSPTTPMGAKATTAPMGVLNQPFEIAELAATAGATYVARSTTYHVTQLQKYLEGAFKHKGFAVVEAISSCPTNFGRRNNAGGPVELMSWQKEAAISVEKASKMNPEELKGRIVTGVVMDRDEPEYVAEYEKIKQAAKARVEDG